MKKLLILFILIAFSTNVFSQKSIEIKLLEVFSPEQTRFILADKQQKDYYTKVINNSYSLVEVNSNKLKNLNFNTLTSVDVKNIDGTITTLSPKELIQSINNGTFNILKLRIDRDLKNKKVFLLENTNYIFSINSFNSLSKTIKK